MVTCQPLGWNPRPIGRAAVLLFERTENAWPAPVGVKNTWGPGERLRRIDWRRYPQPMSQPPRIGPTGLTDEFPGTSVAGRDAGAQAEAAVAFVLGGQQAAQAGHAV